MKKRILSLLLTVALILPLFLNFTGLISADAAESNYVKNFVHYRNSFGDGSDDVGGSISLANATNSTVEIKSEDNGNKYAYLTFNDSSSNVYFPVSPNSTYTPSDEKLGYLILEMDVNIFDKNVETSKFLEIHTGTGSFAPSGTVDGRLAVTNILNFGLSNTFLNINRKNIIYFMGDKNQSVEISKNEWVHVRVELSILDSSSSTYNLKAIVNGKTFESDLTLGTPKTFSYIRIGSTNSTNQCLGMDNITLYSSNENAPSYDQIGPQPSELTMKVGAENALYQTSQFELTNTPLAIDGEVYLPLDVIEEKFEVSCDSRYVQSINSVEYIHIDDVPAGLGLQAKLYDMGLIYVASSDTSLAEEYSTDEIVEIMKKFVFNLPTADGLIADVEAFTSFDHPYLLANQSKFDELRAIYTAGLAGTLTNSEELSLFEILNKYVKTSENLYTRYTGASLSSSYTGILSDMIPVNTNYSKYNNNGYDNGGRSSPSGTPLYQFAFAFQMTGNYNYARLAYDYSLALGAWNHWGPAHFLNCADAAAPFAISYDWLYDAYVALASKGEIAKYDSQVYDHTKLATILFRNAIIPGYIQSNNLNSPWPGTVNSRYATTTNNWNAVCTSGMVASALAIINVDISTAGMTFVTQTKTNGVYENHTTAIEDLGNSSIHIGLNTYSDYAAKLASMNLRTLVTHGLGEYAPDGSYIESPGYWNYGTNTFFRLAASLLSATGDDYGLMDCWGIDTTSYFAIHSESTDNKMWSFNDGSNSSQSTEFFFFTGSFYGDDNLIRVRKKQLASGKGYSLFDLLYYDTTVTGDPVLDKDYYMRGIDGFAVRSSWDKGAIFAGIMGGPNQVSHGHLDAGGFVYHNNGKIWFHDPGSDNYNCTVAGGYFSNFKLYRIGAEGHNILTITSEQDTLPYGQTASASPKIVDTYTCADGGYAVIDLSSSYGNHVISYNRGMLFTDSRSTVIIQDEVKFNGEKTAYWFGHYNVAPGYVEDVKLSYDGKCAFMISGDDILRVSIVSDNENLKFEIMDAYTYVLDITHRTDLSTMDQANTEYNRDTLKKLAIKCENVEELNLAVVIEKVDSYELDTNYSWMNIEDWQIDTQYIPTINEYFKADYDDLGNSIGSSSFKLDSEPYFSLIEKYDGNKFLTLYSNSAQALSSDVTYSFKPNKAIQLSANKYIVLDLDILAESSLSKEAKLSLKVKNEDGEYVYRTIYEFAADGIYCGSSKLSLEKDWMKLTAVISPSKSIIHFYCGNKYISSVALNLPDGYDTLESLDLVFAKGSDPKNTSFSIDNVLLRTLSSSYNTQKLDSIISNRSSLSLWTDAYVRDNSAVALAKSGATYLYSVSEIEAAIAAGNDIEILKDIAAFINVKKPVSITTNGFDVNLTSTSYTSSEIDGVVKFEDKDITVKWHIGTSVFEEKYSASSIASFKGTSSKVGAIKEVAVSQGNGLTIYEYYTTGWARTEGGNYLSDAEMIVSADNCEFYLVNNKPFEASYVVVSSLGNITPYYTANNLASDLKAANNSRIVLTSDIELMHTSAISIPKSGKRLYLNGHTLTYNQNDVHCFYLPAGMTDNFYIYGPGVVTSDIARTFVTSDAGTAIKTMNYGLYAKGVSFDFATTLADLRVGNHKFVDCSINFQSATKNALMSLWNKNTTFTNGIPDNLLSVTFENSDIYVKGKSNTSIISFNASSYSEVTFNSTSIVSDHAVISTSADVLTHFKGNTTVNAAKIVLEATATTKVKVYTGVKTSFELPAELLATGVTKTTSYDSVLPYLYASSYATVNWLDLSGKTLLSEKVAVGTTPKVTDPALISYLRSINTATQKYFYNLPKITGTATRNLSPVKESSDILHTIKLDTDFALVLYFSNDTLTGDITKIEINGKAIDISKLEATTVNGKSYKMHRITGITPDNAAADTKVKLTYTDGSTESLSISVVSYLEKLLLTSNDDIERLLAFKILKYIDTAYIYYGQTMRDDYSVISSVISGNSEYDKITGGLKTSYSDISNLNFAIRSHCLVLRTTVSHRFYLYSSFSGTVEITSENSTKEYVIEDGFYKGHSYIEFELTPDEILSDITITIGGESADYSLNSYATMLKTDDPALKNMLEAIAEYSIAAKEYLKNS